MSKDMIEIISAWGVLILGVASLLLAILTFLSNRRQSQREKIFDLYNAWRGMVTIIPDNLNTPDIVKAVNALFMTATLWNNKIMDRIIIHQSYWDAYKELYDTIMAIKEIPPGRDKRCCDFITSDIKKTYSDMNDPQWKRKIVARLKNKWWR